MIYRNPGSGSERQHQYLPSQPVLATQPDPAPTKNVAGYGEQLGGGQGSGPGTGVRPEPGALAQPQNLLGSQLGACHMPGVEGVVSF